MDYSTDKFIAKRAVRSEAHRQEVGHLLCKGVLLFFHFSIQLPQIMRPLVDELEYCHSNVTADKHGLSHTSSSLNMLRTPL